MSLLYTLGPLAAPTLVLTDTSQPSRWGHAAADPQGVAWLCEHPTGWDDVDFSAPLDRADGVDGALVGPQSIGPRQLGFTGTFIAPDRATAKAATLRLRAALPVRSRVVFALTDDDGQRLWVSGVPSGTFKVVPTSAVAGVFTFALACSDPYKRGDTLRQVTAGLANPSAQTGFAPPLTLGTLVLASAGAVGGGLQAVNLGDAPAWPTATITGPISNPTLTNTTTGGTLTWAITLAAQSVMAVDFRTGLITVDGVQRDVPLLGAAAAYWTLPPGTSAVQFGAVSSYDPGASCALSWYDTYR